MRLFEDSVAHFSPCGKHRMMLARIWDIKKPLIMFIGLNPSTANSETDDPTIRRIRSMVKGWGYGGFYMMNLFTFISTDPKKLNIKEGNLPDSDWWLTMTADSVEKVVFCWGNFNVLGRDNELKKMFPEAWALHINKNGSPKHPLYCRSDSQLIRF
jgi:hypothetical protein